MGIQRRFNLTHFDAMTAYLYLLVTPADEHKIAVGQITRDVARAIAQEWERLLGQRREDELAGLARGERLAAPRVDHLDQEVILLDVQAGARGSPRC